MGPYSIWDDDQPWDGEIPPLHHAAAGLPMPKAGRFFPGQPGSEDWPKVPGYSCARCGCLVGRRSFALLPGLEWFHLWNRSVFCRPGHLDFHLACPYQGE